MPKPTLEDLMNPKVLDAQVRYENRRFAIVESYRLSCEHFNWISAYREEERGKEPTAEMCMHKAIELAPLLRRAIETDLNDAMLILEDKKEGESADKTTTT